MVSVETVTPSWARILKVNKGRKENQRPPLLCFLYNTEPLNPSFHRPTSSKKLGLPLLVQGSSRKYPPSWARAGCPRCSLAAVAVSALKAGTPTLQWNLRTAWSLGPDSPPFRPRTLLRRPSSHIHFSASLRSKVFPPPAKTEDATVWDVKQIMDRISRSGGRVLWKWNNCLGCKPVQPSALAITKYCSHEYKQEMPHSTAGCIFFFYSSFSEFVQLSQTTNCWVWVLSLSWITTSHHLEENRFIIRIFGTLSCKATYQSTPPWKAVDNVSTGNCRFLGGETKEWS